MPRSGVVMYDSFERRRRDVLVIAPVIADNPRLLNHMGSSGNVESVWYQISTSMHSSSLGEQTGSEKRTKDSITFNALKTSQRGSLDCHILL